MNYAFPHAATRCVYDLVQGSVDWHNMRSGRVTGTRGARILIGKEEEVMREMIRDVRGAPSETFVNDAMKRGTKMEPVARNDYREYTNKTGFEAGMIIHRDLPWLSYSPDWIITEFGEVAAHLEIKVPFSGLYEEVPPQYIEQCRLGMEVIGVKKSDLYVWSETDSFIMPLEADPDWWVEAEPKLYEFYQEFLRIKDDDKACAQYLRPKVYMRGDPDWAAAAKAYKRAVAKLEKAEAGKDAAKETLIEAANGKSCSGYGVRAIITTSSNKIVWRTQVEKERK